MTWSFMPQRAPCNLHFGDLQPTAGRGRPHARLRLLAKDIIYQRCLKPCVAV
jgi:hypothetical protein